MTVGVYEGQENTWRKLWEWLTGNGASNPGTTPPTIGTTVASDTTAGVMTNSADVTVDDTAGGVTVLAANANRKKCIIQNVGAAACRVGTTTPTTTTGLQLAPGASLTLEGPYPVQAAIKAIRETGTNTTVSVAEIV